MLKIKITNFLLVLIFASGLLFPSLAQELKWQELKGDHFIIYFNPSQQASDPSNLDAAFAQEILNKAELYYQRIALDLGYPRYSEFWTWEKRVKIYIYPEHDDFVKASGHPTWSDAMADYETKTILSYIGSQEFDKTILPHEIAHLIFRDFVGFKGEIPLWLDEGVAQWEEEGKQVKIKSLVKQLSDRDSLLSLKDMTKLDIRTIVHKNNVYMRRTCNRQGEPAVLFLSGDNLVKTYYVQAASLVGFIIEKFGSVDFAHFCRQLRDGKQVEEALIYVYGTYIHDINEFETLWRKYIAEGK